MSDVIVVGLGADGSAAAAELARRGEHIVGIEAFPRGRTLGSSGGLTRVIRLAYEAGANSYLVKPVEFTEMVEMMRHVSVYWLGLNQRFPLSAAAASSDGGRSNGEGEE